MFSDDAQVFLQLIFGSGYWGMILAWSSVSTEFSESFMKKEKLLSLHIGKICHQDFLEHDERSLWPWIIVSRDRKLRLRAYLIISIISVTIKIHCFWNDVEQQAYRVVVLFFLLTTNRDEFEKDFWDSF